MRTLRKMRERLLVGLTPWLWSPNGASNEGHQQWFYTLATLIHVMLAWGWFPRRATVFTALWLLHFATIYFVADRPEDSDSMGEFFIFATTLLIIIGLCNSWWWTLFSIALSTFGYWLAELVEREYIRGVYAVPYFACIVLFAFFVAATCATSFAWWLKAIIILLTLALHPLIDYGVSLHSFDIGLLMDSMKVYLQKKK